MRAWKVFVLVVGLLVATTGLGFMTGGGGLLAAHTAGRDDGGYFASPVVPLRSPTHAITSERLHFGGDIEEAGWTPARLGDLRLRVTSRSEEPLFVGVGDADQVAAYLASSAHDRLDEVRGRVATFETHDGNVVPPPPADQDFWVASTVGTGPRTLNWEIESGDWEIVVMQADASAGLDVRATAGLRTQWLLAIGLGLLFAGVVGFAFGLVLIILSVRRSTPPPVPGSPVHLPHQDVAAIDAPQDAYPLRLSGHLDLTLSRWLWLVKWVLVIPHLLVLSVLWMAASLFTLVAGVAILFTGRYPRSIFDFNQGVLRWTWRVTFYAFTLGTDRYPPFSLGVEPAYPADLTIEYPDRLSRPMVLVKWILALPHLIVIALFSGGIALDWSWVTDSTDVPRMTIGGGVVSLVVLIAAVALLFTGRYPQALFDLVMGMERWSFRVFSYLALMTDEYPPFRFDMGGTDPSDLPHFPPSPSTTADAGRELR